MEVGHVVRFSSQKHPFLIEASPCLDLDCSCSITKLTLTEFDPSGPLPKEQLTFTLRMCVKNWDEHDPPPRSLEVESLVREFIARFPTERIRALAKEFERARRTKERLVSASLTGTPDQPASYSAILGQGEIRENVIDRCFFFVFEGREFLVEDHYCTNPQCNCQQVRVEFWERVLVYSLRRRVHIEPRLFVSLGFDGARRETFLNRETASKTESLLRAWHRRCAYQLQTFRRRYEVVKQMGALSFPSESAESVSADSDTERQPVVRDFQPASTRRTGRNDSCPCGSGRKFKRCCGRQFGIGAPVQT
jgi:hypothetical protein